MPALVLGPLLRFVGSTPEGGFASIWVETDAACEVQVLGCTEPTFCVAGHHYALVQVTDLPEQGVTSYDVLLDGERVWPLDSGRPASTIRTRGRTEPVRLAFGSCRVTGPLDDTSLGVDALHALAERMARQDPVEWPDELLLVGDQVYADENISPQTRAFIASRRDPEVGAGSEVADFEEYTHLYREAWSIEPIRWLLSTVPSAMIFDDHDVRDDWNTSAQWREQMRAEPWWQGRIEAGLMTYWLYQHLGNLGHEELDSSELLAQLKSEEDGEKVLRDYASRADAEADGGGPTRWSFRRDLGTSRLLVMDSRCGRVLADDRRDMFDEPEWEWLGEQVRGDHDHLLLATSVPFLLPPGVHHLEAFDEALTAGVWGERAARLGEKLRQGADLEHWAAFGKSFERMSTLVQQIAGGRLGRPPATITFLSGDVHFAYLAEASVRDGTRVHQAVCSPLRNPLPRAVSLGQRAACSRLMGSIGRALARAARVDAPPFDWQVTGGPAFGNEVSMLELHGRSLLLTVEKAVPGPGLVHAFTSRLS